MKPKTYRLATLGCRTNQYESQGYAAQLRRLGYEAAGEGEPADVCVVNTCTVTEGADASSRHEIRKLLKENPCAQVFVTGCMADKVQGNERLKVVLNADKERLIEQVMPGLESYPEFQIEAFEGRTRAFVKVQDGCNSFCTYCIIPYVRGRSRSRGIEDVVREVEGLVAAGYGEVVLTGINIGDFEAGLAHLVRAVDRVPGLKRLRVSSIDPDEVNDDLLAAILEGKTTCPSMHIVLQSGSNVILKRMNRTYTIQIFTETIERLKAAHPDFTFTTDVIVGFPGETEGDHRDTLRAIEQVQFAKVHMFPYSPRERTRAALYPNRVPSEVIHRRKQEVMRLSEQVAFQLRERFVGRRMPVLMEEGNRGHTANFLPVLVEAPPRQMVTVELIENTPEGLRGRIV